MANLAEDFSNEFISYLALLYSGGKDITDDEKKVLDQLIAIYKKK